MVSKLAQTLSGNDKGGIYRVISVKGDLRNNGRAAGYEVASESANLKHPVRNPWRALVDGEAVVWPAALCGLIVAGISLLVGPDRGDVEVDVAMVSVTTFLFGVLLGFTIARLRDRLAIVQNLIAEGHACLLSIYQMVEVFGEDERNCIRELIDGHLTEQIDFRLVDNHMAMGSFVALTEAVYRLDPQTIQQQHTYKELLVQCNAMNEDRMLMEAATGQNLSAVEWGGLLLLFLLLVSLAAVLPGGRLLGAVVVGVLTGTLVTFMVIVRMLDRLRWHERVTIWEPTARLFRTMGRDPYVPHEVILTGRFRPSGRVRVVDYPDPYPARSTKVVRVVELNS